MLSQTAEYALRAVLYLARQEEGRRVQTSELAEALSIPRNYLSKTMSTLVGRGVLDSARGPRGGFRLAIRPTALTVARVVDTFDPPGARSGCLLGGGPCRPDDPCSAHGRWSGVALTVRTFFIETTVADLVADAPPGTGRPAPAEDLSTTGLAGTGPGPPTTGTTRDPPTGEPSLPDDISSTHPTPEE